MFIPMPSPSPSLSLCKYGKGKPGRFVMCGDMMQCQVDIQKVTDNKKSQSPFVSKDWRLECWQGSVNTALFQYTWD